MKSNEIKAMPDFLGAWLIILTLIYLQVKISNNSNGGDQAKARGRQRRCYLTQAWDVAQVRFVFDGERVKPEQTPQEIGLEDGDCIDAILEQLGGCLLV
ncbi:hypothetical protein Ndes2526A_g05563 [Nannochloris sp. 'desiccata']